MSDPWADLRERLEWYQRDGIKRMTETEFVRLLTDATALLAVVRAAKPAVVRLQLIQKAGPLGKSPKWTQDLVDALDALPRHLKAP